MERKTLSQVIPNNQLIAFIPAPLPWGSEIKPEMLDIEYFFNHSGEKLASPFALKMCDDSETIPSNNLLAIGVYLKSRFGRKWERLYQTMTVEYNPIENYNSEETERRAGTNTNKTTKSGSDTFTKTGTDTESVNGTVSDSGKDDRTLNRNVTTNEIKSGQDELSKNVDETVLGQNNNAEKVNAFNSPTAVPKDEQTGTDNTKTTGKNLDTTKYGGVVDGTDIEETTDGVVRTNTQTTDNTNTVTHNTTDTTTYGGVDSGEGSTNEERVMSRHGNIGVTTTQQMLTSERELWEWDFFNAVFNDVDSIMTLPIY